LVGLLDGGVVVFDVFCGLVNCFIYSVLNFAVFVTIGLQFVVNVSSSNHYVICVGLISMMRIHYFLSVQCYAWTEYKFTCVCVRHTFCQLAYRSDPSTDFYS